jgi:inositol-phosphate phosphatase/L-galactose 1-phosphate phosphatase/histidinol-phosphatase
MSSRHYGRDETGHTGRARTPLPDSFPARPDPMPEASPQELLKAALEISETAAAIPMQYFRSPIAVEDKPDESPVTIADRETEAHIRRAIEERFPDHGIFGEEFGKSGGGAANTWIIDPIDGTRSFICGIPLFGMLLGVLAGDEPVAGVIRMPALGETFAGCRGAGATKDGVPIRCRETTRLEDARLIINEANRLLTNQPELLARLTKVGQTRRFFNDCYPFALLAMGQIDVVVDSDLQPYDYLPIVPVVQAAGGMMTDWGGERLGLKSDGNVVAAATPELHREIMNRLR